MRSFTNMCSPCNLAKKVCALLLHRVEAQLLRHVRFIFRTLDARTSAPFLLRIGSLAYLREGHSFRTYENPILF